MTRGQEWSGAATDAPHTHNPARRPPHIHIHYTHDTRNIAHAKCAAHLRPPASRAQATRRQGRGKGRLTAPHTQSLSVSYRPPPRSHSVPLPLRPHLRLRKRASASGGLTHVARSAARAQPEPSRSSLVSRLPILPSPLCCRRAMHQGEVACLVSRLPLCRTLGSLSLACARSRSPRSSTWRRRRSSLQVDVVDVAVVAVGVGVLSTCRRRRCRWRP